MIKVVLDSNVFISGLLTNGICRSILKSFAKNEFQLFISPLIFEEILAVLKRPKIRPLIDNQDIFELMTILKLQANIVNPKIIVSKCRDPEDNHILALAISPKADFIVSRDKDLLVLHPFLNISIITPPKFKNFIK